MKLGAQGHSGLFCCAHAKVQRTMQAAFRATFKAIKAISDVFVAAAQYAGGPLGDIRLVLAGRWGAEAPHLLTACV